MKKNSPIAPKTVLATFPSKSRPGQIHTVSLGADGVMYCSCGKWVFQRVAAPFRDPCTHMLDLMGRITVGGASLRAQGAVPVAPKPVRPARKAKAEKPASSFWTKL